MCNRAHSLSMVLGFVFFSAIAHSEDRASLPAISQAARSAKQLITTGRYKEALDLLNPAAEAGDGDACFLLGQMYENGNGIHESIKKAMLWYRKGADAGSLASMYQAGAFLLIGRDGVTADPATGLKLVTTAATRGYPPAEYGMGSAYFQGRGVAMDLKRAVTWMLKAADHDDPDAALFMGELYMEGREVPVDYDKAHQLLHLAANSGNTERHTDAILLIVRLCGRMKAEFGPDLGHEVKTPFPEAASSCNEADLISISISISSKSYVNGVLIKEQPGEGNSSGLDYPAAERGDADAQRSIARTFIRQDLPLALFWLSLAARHGDAAAMKALKSLDSELDEADQAAFNRFMKAWAARHPETPIVQH